MSMDEHLPASGDTPAWRRPPTGDASGPHQPGHEHQLFLDPQSLRAVAHPVRLRLLGLLRTNGPSTATRLAQHLGLNSGATSYHLRQLAQYGLIHQDDERGTGRERWWRAAHRFTWFDLAEAPPEDQEAGSAYLRAIALVYADLMQRAAEESSTLPTDWQRAGTFTDLSFRLDPTEAKQLVDELMDVLSRYRVEDPDQLAPAGTEPFHVQLQAFLRPGHLPEQSES